MKEENKDAVREKKPEPSLLFRLPREKRMRRTHRTLH